MNDVIASVLESSSCIDLLKVDIEGLETRVIESIRPELLQRIRSIVFEGRATTQLHPRHYEQSIRGECIQLWLREIPDSASDTGVSARGR